MIAQVVLAGNKLLDEVYNEVQIATGKINNDMTSGAVSSGSRVETPSRAS
ncbi:MAG: hypothetical protein KGK16_13330 [Bradyrhizobium sp.]|nr:hypothetical protein [Bradyrhizobium sp.]